MSNATAPPPGARYRFGRFEIDTAAGLLYRDGAEVPLRRQTWQLFCLLVAEPRRLCKKDELRAAIWPRTVVGDDSLVQCVVELRRALGDGERRLLRTVARVGYRLDAAIEPAEPRPAPAAGIASAGPLAPAWQRLTAAESRVEVGDARRLFEDGVDLPGQRADALAGIALGHVIEVLNRWAACPAWSVTLAREAANEAMALDPTNARACHARAHVAMQDGQPFDALLGFRAALARDPAMARARLRMGVIEMELGHPERTRGHVESALALDAGGADDVLRAQAFFIDGMASFQLGRDGEAAAAMHRVLALRPEDGLAHEWIAAIDALGGALRSSEDHLAIFRRSVPGHTLASLRDTERSRQPLFKRQRDRFYEGLRRAGLQ